MKRKVTQNHFDAVVIGNVGIDTNIYFQGDRPDLTIESSFTENIDCIGQAGGFASRGFARIGKYTSFIGYVGNDYHGRFIREEFSRDGIDMSALFIDPAGTCRSINLVSKDGTRKNFYDGKSHMTLVPDLDKCSRILSNTTIAHFNIPNWARFLLPQAKKAETTISCDLQDVVTINDEYRADFVSFADIVFFSAVNFPDPAPMIQSLLAIKPALIVIAGMGARGCALGTMTGGIQYFEAVQSGIPVIDTNGAGDALAVGFLSSFVLDGFNLSESILRGQIAARYACTQKACSSSLMTKSELDSIYDKMLNKST